MSSAQIMYMFVIVVLSRLHRSGVLCSRLLHSSLLCCLLLCCHMLGRDMLCGGMLWAVVVANVVTVVSSAGACSAMVRATWARRPARSWPG